jgi:hypothetical protein
MSFGFGVGDFVAAADLAWNLYQNYYRVARVAPQELKLLQAEILTLHSAISILQADVNHEKSVLRRSGEDRVRVVNETMSRVTDTLKELERVSMRYQKILSDTPRPKLKQMWDKLGFAIDAPNIDAIRNKVRNRSLRSFRTLTRVLSTSCNTTMEY